MYRIEYGQYLDKVYGCWIGKCISGTIGAPYEGMKELLNFKYDPAMIANMLPNDDLDLQVLWLSVLEDKGIAFSSDDLADAFYFKCPYAPGEYAYFKKNYARGIHPPLCGEYNNRYYVQGMGCPIRSEIWACIAPGNPELAAELSEKDGVLDHAGESVYAEQFLAGLESAAFFESDLDKLVDIGLSVIPTNCKIAKLVRKVRNWCEIDLDWRRVRSRVIREYGHPDCTNLFQNIGVTLLSLYLGEMDFIKTTMIALNCGFDTDCTCATAGSILGILAGANRLMNEHGFTDQGYVLEVKIQRRSLTLQALAEDTCAMGLHFAQINPQIEINGAPSAPAIELPVSVPVSITVDYNGVPAIGVGDTKCVSLRFANSTNQPISGTAALDIPENWAASSRTVDLDIAPNQSAVWNIELSVPADIESLNEKNICHVEFKPAGFGSIEYTFGIVGAAVWQVFGPFWQNNVDMPELAPGESYFKYIPGANKDDGADQARTYHLNTRVDPKREYMTMDEILNPKSSQDAAKDPVNVNIYEDLFSVNDLIGFQGPCAVYMVRRLISPEERKVGVLVGHTDAYSLWINGELISERDNTDWWTAENAHIHDVPIKQGENTIVVKLSRRSAKADFSLLFTTGGACTEHYCDFASANPEGIMSTVA